MSHLENYLRIDDVPYQESILFIRICTQNYVKVNPAVVTERYAMAFKPCKNRKQFRPVFFTTEQ
jgi:hypothetical protein